MLSRPALALFVLVSTAPVCFASVLVVSPSGPFTSPQAAIAAASDGDVVLVKAGTYFGSCAVNDKSLVITADAGASATLQGELRVTSLAATREVLVSGLTIRPLGMAQPFEALILLDNAGTIRIQDCDFRGSTLLGCASTPQPLSGGRVVRSTDVAFVDCSVAADSTPSHQSNQAAGLIVEDSRVTLSDCVLTGGTGGATCIMSAQPIGQAGADGLRATTGAGEVWLSGCVVNGGPGGSSFQSGMPAGTGGASVRVGAAFAFHFRDSALLGGTGGLPFGSSTPVASGAPIADAPGAVVVAHAGAARSFAASTVVRASTSRTFTFTGLPGDSIALYSNRTGEWLLDPVVDGVREIAVVPAARFLRYGVVPASGDHTVVLAVPALAAGVESVVTQMQPVHRELGGTFSFAPARFTVIVDPSF